MEEVRRLAESKQYTIHTYDLACLDVGFALLALLSRGSVP